MRRSEILVYMSSANTFATMSGIKPGGCSLPYLSEALGPVFEAAFEIEFATPDGRPCHIDPHSESLEHWDGDEFERGGAQGMLAAFEDACGFLEPTPIDSILSNPARLGAYDMLYVPGGPSLMTDLLYEGDPCARRFNRRTAALLEHFHGRRALTVLTGHAPALLATARAEHDGWPYAGYAMTCVPMTGSDTRMSRRYFGADWALAQTPRDLLAARGAEVLTRSGRANNLIHDRELCTVQDPVSVHRLGRYIFTELTGRAWGDHPHEPADNRYDSPGVHAEPDCVGR